MQSIEHALRAVDKSMADEKERLARCEKMLGDFQEQLGKPFKYEARLKELLKKQNELNPKFDLDKGERQVAPRTQLKRMRVMAGCARSQLPPCRACPCVPTERRQDGVSSPAPAYP